MKLTSILYLTCLCMVFTSLAQSSWQPVEGHIMTAWAKQLKAEDVHAEYPRPQLVRKQWKNLNGLWDYSIVDANSNTSDEYDGKILVPFPVESALSGVKKRVGQDKKIWYRRSFEVPAKWKNKRVLLHFGAVDWETQVYVNDQFIGTHEGGFDAFSMDITDALQAAGSQELVISVWDPTSDGTQPRGKQVVRPSGIYYTPVSGIWQTVWLEPVNRVSIADVITTPDIDAGEILIRPTINGLSTDLQTKITVSENGKVIGSAQGKAGSAQSISIDEQKLWSPDNPFLYDLTVQLLKKGKVVDEVQSYFGMRKISKEVDAAGHERFYLNNEPIFMYGTLDQGWWPDGLYTAPSDEALIYDIQQTKDMGFNTIRKHVKVESDRWFYHCDRLGMLVWQDMPSGDKSADWRGPSGYDGREMNRNPQSTRQFMREWQAIMDDHLNNPSIVMWVPFNEGWGQFNTVKVTEWTMDYDPSRLVNGPSGGNFFPTAHTVDHHQYPGPGMPNPEEHAPNIMNDRIILLGEFGGLGLPLEGHLWQADKNWGYRNYGTQDELLESYTKLINQIPALIKNGLGAAIYTQTTDVEGEVNGLMTYDRKVVKMDPDKMKELHQQLYQAIKK